jgi:dTMP kinase
MMERGRMITIEGVDGAGKTTLATGLREALLDRGVDARLLREPGGVQASERIRELVKDPALSIGPRAEALLYAAARAQLVEEALEPLLREGSWILLDRFTDSSLAYQGVGRELGMSAVRHINEFATGNLIADRTLLLVIDPEVATARSSARGEPPDRLEQEGFEFQAAVARGYLELADAEPDRIVVIDASQSAELVLQSALAAVADLI